MISRSLWMQTEVSPPDVIAHIQSVVVAVGGAALLQLFGSLSVHICLSAAHLAAFQPSWSDPPPEQTASEPLPASRCVSIILASYFLCTSSLSVAVFILPRLLASL